jgi:hypothetical protein
MEKTILRSPKTGGDGSSKPDNAVAVPVAKPKPALTPSQQAEFERLDKVIKSGWKTFLEVGTALTQVRDQKLYRDKYGSFEAYCRVELGFSRPYAYNLIGSAEVNEQLSSIEDIKVKPLLESQLRELISVPEKKRAEAWKKAVALAGDRPLTARIVHKAALKFKPRKGGQGKTKTTKPATDQPVNLEVALLMIDHAAGLAKGNDTLLTSLTALRKLLLSWAGKTVGQEQ